MKKIILLLFLVSCDCKVKYVNYKYPQMAPDMKTFQVCNAIEGTIKEDIIYQMDKLIINGSNNLMQVKDLMARISNTIYCDIDMEKLLKPEEIQ